MKPGLLLRWDQHDFTMLIVSCTAKTSEDASVKLSVVLLNVSAEVTHNTVKRTWFFDHEANAMRVIGAPRA